MDYIILLNTPLFRGLSLDDIVKSVSDIPFRLRKYRSGTLIEQSGATVNYFLMVVNGMVKGEMTDFSGRVIKIEDIPAPGAIAAAFIFGSRNRFPVNVIAVTDCEILIIDKNEFLKFLKRNDIILANYLDMISNRSQFLSEKIKFLNFKTIKSKLAQYILQSADRGNSEIRLGMTQNDMAEYFGVARPSIARVIKEMEDAGIIVTKGRQIRILDRKKLEGLTME